MVRLVRTRHRCPTVFLLPVHAGCCHFICPFLFGCYFVSIGIKANSWTKAMSNDLFTPSVLNQKLLRHSLDDRVRLILTRPCGVGNCYDNAMMEAFFSTLKTECFPENQVFSSRAQARRELFEYIELYYNNQRLHSALGYQTPRKYETKFGQVIDIESNRAQSLDAEAEDRALRGRTSSADADLQTAGVAAYGRPTGPRPAPAGASPKRKIPGGSGDRVAPIPSINSKENRELRVRFFGGKYTCSAA
jgi:integrase-like protein